MCFQDCIFICSYKYLGSIRMKISESFSRYWHSLFLFKLFLMKSFWKFEGIPSWSLISPNVVLSLPRAPTVPSFKLLLKHLSVMTSSQMHPAAIFDILELRANSKSRNVLQFVRSWVCAKGDNLMMIAADGRVNNMSHVVKTERTSDFLLLCSLVEVLANNWDTPNSSVLTSSFERVDQKSFYDLSFFSTVTEYASLFSDSFWFFSYLPDMLKTFFVILWSIGIHILWVENSKIHWTEIHLSWEEFSVLCEYIQNR